MNSPDRPLSKRQRGVILTSQALQVLVQALHDWWDLSTEKEQSKSKTLSDEQKAWKLEVAEKTVDRIFQQKGVDRNTLRHAFHRLGIPWKEEYCVRPTSEIGGSLPALPLLLLGREQAIQELKQRLFIDPTAASATGIPHRTQVLTAVRGWPGVGKTSIAAFLAHDPEVQAAFPDGVLWTTLGTAPDVRSLLTTWGHQLRIDIRREDRSVETISAQLRTALLNKRLLLIVDDVWREEHAIPFRVGGIRCAMLLTTRESRIAQALAPRAQDVYVLPVLDEAAALELLAALAPEVVQRHESACRVLCRELEGLPLALQVAGRLLHEEASAGLDVKDLLKELREGVIVLNATAPADRVDLVQQTTPTVVALLQKSTDRLDPQTRECFARLGPFAPKPATFDLDALRFVWEMEDPRPVVKTLAGRGLLEPLGEGRFQMHALLIAHADSLLKD